MWIGFVNFEGQFSFIAVLFCHAPQPSQSVAHKNPFQLPIITPWKQRNRLCLSAFGFETYVCEQRLFASPLRNIRMIFFHMHVNQITFRGARADDKDKWGVLITVCGANVF